jgi:hypothetical protein
MAITPTNSLLSALSNIGSEAIRPRPAPDGIRAPATPVPAKPVTASAVPTAAPDPTRPMPRGSFVNLVV